MNFGPKDLVALVLAAGTMGVMLFGVYNAGTVLEAGHGPEFIEKLQLVTEFWREMLLVIIGALAGYIAGKN